MELTHGEKIVIVKIQVGEQPQEVLIIITLEETGETTRKISRNNKNNKISNNQIGVTTRIGQTVIRQIITLEIGTVIELLRKQMRTIMLTVL
jgi:hypothetical protein